jgi:hyperosmotically inducible protein
LELGTYGLYGGDVMNNSSEEMVIRQEIADALRKEPGIAGDINVEVDGRHVIISGVVSTLKEKELAGKIARSFGPIQLENDIVIETGENADDDSIMLSAQNEIDSLGSTAGGDYSIGVDRVEDGVVYLKGRSSSVGPIDAVAAAASKAQGARDIVSEVKIETARPAGDIDITNHVEQALSEEPSIHIEFIDVRVKDGKVLLSGNVKTTKQKSLATAITRQVPGVVSVENILSTELEPNDIDKALELQTIKALESAMIDMRDMNVSVLDGVTFLDGFVYSTNQKERAFEIAKAIQGIRLVQDNLAIGYHIEPKAG